MCNTVHIPGKVALFFHQMFGKNQQCDLSIRHHTEFEVRLWRVNLPGEYPGFEPKREQGRN